MKKLTAEKCRERIRHLNILKQIGGLPSYLDYDLQALEIALPIIEQQERDSKLHHWDATGERCLKCGDKDWMADPVCSGGQQESQKEVSHE